MEAEQTERCGAIQWVKEHKTVLIAIGVGAIGTFLSRKLELNQGTFQGKRISSLRHRKSGNSCEGNCCSDNSQGCSG